MYTFLRTTTAIITLTVPVVSAAATSGSSYQHSGISSYQHSGLHEDGRHIGDEFLHSGLHEDDRHIGDEILRDPNNGLDPEIVKVQKNMIQVEKMSTRAQVTVRNLGTEVQAFNGRIHKAQDTADEALTLARSLERKDNHQQSDSSQITQDYVNTISGKADSAHELANRAFGLAETNKNSLTSIVNTPGTPGRPGIPGRHGKDGAIGPAGPQGKRGYVGATGKRGPAGPEGDPGKDGKDGLIGMVGERGATGPAGPQGKPGLDGVPGMNGLDGRDGAQGPAGPQGDKGDPGKDGMPGEDTVARAQIADLDNANSALHSRIGDLERNLTNATGIQGEVGPEGPRGPKGLNGLNGMHGKVGPQGPQGDVGPQGKDGRDGVDGKDGASGKDGIPGEDAHARTQIVDLKKNLGDLQRTLADAKNAKENALKIAKAAEEAQKALKKNFNDLKEEQRESASIHNSLSGIKYVFAEGNKISIANSVGFHNTTHVAVGVGVAYKPRENMMFHGAIATSQSLENFGGHVGWSVSF